MTRPPVGGKVLVIDDDASIRTLVTTILCRGNFEVETASGGAEALAMIAERQYDAILLDLMMPVMSGFDVLACLASSGWPHGPVIVMSAAPPEVIAAAETLNIAGTLQKPFPFDNLLEAVQAAIAAAGAETGAHVPKPCVRLTMDRAEPDSVESIDPAPDPRKTSARSGRVHNAPFNRGRG